MLCCRSRRQIAADYTDLFSKKAKTREQAPKRADSTRFQADLRRAQAGNEVGVRLHKVTGGHRRATRRRRRRKSPPPATGRTSRRPAFLISRARVYMKDAHRL